MFRVFRVHNFVSPSEIASLIQSANRKGLARSATGKGGVGIAGHTNAFRTSENAWCGIPLHALMTLFEFESENTDNLLSNSNKVIILLSNSNAGRHFTLELECRPTFCSRTRMPANARDTDSPVSMAVQRRALELLRLVRMPGEQDDVSPAATTPMIDGLQLLRYR
eukprot:SAG31_NODE_6496_length_1995_cov_1.791139_3_plen_166_part_00